MICTLYAHEIGFDRITKILNDVFPKGIQTVTTQDDSQIVEVELKGGLLAASKRLKISYRQRNKPSYKFTDVDDSALTKNLKGLYGFVASLPTANEYVRGLFLQKITTLNCEFSISEVKGEILEIKSLIQQLATEFDAILFAQPKTVISRSQVQHFLDRHLKLIIDSEGSCEIDALDVKINAQYFDKEQASAKPDQHDRKARSEKILEQRNVKQNRNLPFVASESETILRTPKEIAQRVTVLAMTNLVAFDSISAEEAMGYLTQFNLWQYVTPQEQDFLTNPTEERKSYETWKCEDIWVLLWALNKVKDLGFPNELCNLSHIAAEDYPVGPDKNPNDFIDSISTSRGAAEILDANHLYYRMDWVCVDARMKNEQPTALHPGVVYERHYALNWLIRYQDQAWDDVSCDT